MSGRDDLERVRAARAHLTASGPAVEREPGDFERVSLPAHDADALRDTLIADGADVVIEIGLAYGSSALAIAEALVAREGAGRRHLVIDAFQDQFFESGWDELRRAAPALDTTLIRERSQTALPRLLTEGFVADAAFVDGSHVFHNVFLDLAFLRELVRPGGLVILDDCQWASVATAVRYFEANCGWEQAAIAADSSRLRAYRLPDPPAEPSFEDFRPFGID